MKKIVITGGLGFIGSNLVRKLCKNYHVLIVDKQTYSSNLDNLSGISKKNYTLYKIDICNQNKFYNLIRKHSPICIFNLAAETHVDRSIDSPREFINTNILGTYSILEALRKYHKKNKKIKFIHISTDEVYGDIKKKSFSKESDPYKPSSPYAASKASSDHLVYSYFRTFKLPVIVTNCSNNYGPRQFPEKLIPKIIINCLNNKPVPIYGNGLNENIACYIYFGPYHRSFFTDTSRAFYVSYIDQFGLAKNSYASIVLNRIDLKPNPFFQSFVEYFDLTGLDR